MPRQSKTKRRTRKHEPSAEALLAPSRPRKTTPASKASQRTRLARLRKALSSGASIDALAKVRELVPDDGAGPQEVVVHGFACLLETSSAGLSILFDRFDETELRKIGASLERIGATRTLAAVRRLQKAFERAVREGRDRMDAATLVSQLPEAHKVDRQSQAYVDEMQQKLLKFCRAHVQELAAG